MRSKENVGWAFKGIRNAKDNFLMPTARTIRLTPSEMVLFAHPTKAQLLKKNYTFAKWLNLQGDRHPIGSVNSEPVNLTYLQCF